MTRSKDEGFLSRWSRRKAEEEVRADPVPREPPAAPAAVETGPAAGPAPETSPEPPEPSAEPLPDPETLGRDADWSRFLRPDVPAVLRARALRRLWSLDPVFANLDGLVDYAEDYNDPAVFGGPVRTLYQVGRGIFAPEEPAAERVAQDTAGRAEDEGAPEAAAPGPTAPEAPEPPDGVEAASDPAGAAAALPAPAAPRRPAGSARGALARRWGVQSRPDSRDGGA